MFGVWVNAPLTQQFADTHLLSPSCQIVTGSQSDFKNIAWLFQFHIVCVVWEEPHIDASEEKYD